MIELSSVMRNCILRQSPNLILAAKTNTDKHAVTKRYWQALLGVEVSNKVPYYATNLLSEINYREIVSKWP